MASDLTPPQCINYIGEVFIFRDKKTGLYVGYDGYDTDFSKGISAFILEDDILNAFNKELIHYNLQAIEEMLSNSADKMWSKVGGVNKVDIVRMDIMIDGEAFSAADLMHVLTIEKLEAEEDDRLQLNLDLSG